MNASRRNFLAAGLALPAVASASRSAGPEPQAPPARGPSSGPVFQYRTLGNTGLKVTTVGFGCMITSDGSVITRAADLGITYFDTARVYSGGNNERMVGAALKGKRNSITLSTKTQARTKADALAHIDTSLKELGTDHVDIWYLHARSAPADITDELIEAQQEAKKAGKIRFAGVSTHQGHTTLIPFLAKNPNIDVILSSYNFAVDPAISAVLEEAAKAGKGVVAMKVMGGGMGGGTAGGRGGIVQPPAAKPGNRLAALKWVTRNANVATTVPSMTDMDQLDENIRAMASPFTPADQQLLAERREQIRPYYCNMCGKCAGSCRYGLPVEDVLRYGMYADGYGQFALGREHFKTLSAEHAAVRCATCPGCTVQCPEGVHVAERLTHIQGMLA